MSYRAPIKDMLFNIQHLAGLETLTKQVPAFEDFGLDTAAAVLEE
ncbi:acyl-CoA dehydrogenase N-terminal domain-containing protein, partial [Roseateles sp. P5_E11]